MKRFKKIPTDKLNPKGEGILQENDVLRKESAHNNSGTEGTEASKNGHAFCWNVIAD